MCFSLPQSLGQRLETVSYYLNELYRLQGLFSYPKIHKMSFLVRICFAMTINKAQEQSIPGTLGIDLHGQLHFALLRTKNSRNVFILTTDGSNRTKNVVISELFDMSHNTPRVPKSVVPETFDSKTRIPQPDIYFYLA